jgi:acetylornithine deacetylase/succinyl-diaminopimelate desuccinylase-like protein
MAAFVAPPIAADMRAIVAPTPDAAAVDRLSKIVQFNAQMRTTCVATMLEGGHAINALPQTVSAAVNCRVLPGEALDDVRATLVRVLDDEQISVTLIGAPVPSPPSPLNPELVRVVERLTAEFWPGIPVIPMMSAGATDGSLLRNAGIPTYGHSGLAGDVNDVRAHGKDERVLVRSFLDGHEYLYRLVKALASDSK